MVATPARGSLSRPQKNRFSLSLSAPDNLVSQDLLGCLCSRLLIWSCATGSFVLSHPSRALSLRNLVLGYECGRVFPAGVGPGSPSRDAVNWLPSRFSLSVETRRRFGWLRMMVFPGAHLFRAPIWWSSEGWRHARGREHCRGEPGSSLSGGYAPDSAKAEGSSIVDEPGEG